MKILNKLTFKNLLMNKRRTMVTIVGIILAVSLICAVGGMATSLRESLFQLAINQHGYYHLSIEVEEEDLEKLRVNRDIRDIMTINKVGYASLSESKNEYKPYMRLFSMDEVTFKNLHFSLKEGRFPENENDIIISKAIITNAKVKYNVGDKIKLNLGYRYDNDGVITSGRYIICEEDDKCQDEKFAVEQSREVVIVGIIERPSYRFEPFSEAGYTIITTNIPGEKKSAYITLKNPNNYSRDISEILGIKSLDDQIDSAYEEVNINREVLRYESFLFSENDMLMLISIIAVVIAIIIVTSVFCIRNSFNISIVEKTKMFGMLASIGATKKQIKKSVLMEGFILGLIAIPLGILAGIFADFVLIKVLNYFIGDYFFGDNSGFFFKISPLIILFSVILSLLTIYLSTIKAAKRASKIDPIEAIRNSGEIKINSKKMKSSKIIHRLFKVSGDIAHKNLRRSRKKYRTTVISIVVSVTTFITMSSFIYYAFRLGDVYYNNYDYDIQVYLSNSQADEEDITSIEAIDEYSISYVTNRNVKVSDMSHFTNFGYDIYAEGASFFTINFVGLDDKSFRNYIESLGLDYDKVKDKAILNDHYLYGDKDGKMTEKRLFDYQSGDIIKGVIDDESDYQFVIGAVVDEFPQGYGNINSRSGIYVVNVDLFDDLSFGLNFITINAKDIDKVIYELDKISTDLVVNNYKKQAQEERSMVIVYSIFLYGFITVISLIGMTNIFNTITSNIKLRQREFAVYKSIGMTKREFNRMTNLETLFYSFKSLTYGIIFGLIGSYFMYKAYASGYDSGYVIPYKAILMAILVVCILVFTIMHYSIAKVNKQNIIETIRNENI